MLKINDIILGWGVFEVQEIFLDTLNQKKQRIFIL